MVVETVVFIEGDEQQGLLPTQTVFGHFADFDQCLLGGNQVGARVAGGGAGGCDPDRLQIAECG